MTRPPPNGTPAQSDRTSTPQICTIASASRGRSIGIGPMGATAGAAVVAGAPDGAAAGAPPPIAATALRHAAESCVSLRLRHCNASAPPGCTPEQWDMKSDRHAARTAAVCCAVGFAARGCGAAGAAGAAGAGGALARAGSAGFGSTGFLAGAACFTGSAGAAAAGGGAAGSDCTAAWQLGERSAALAFKHCRISGLFGAIQEQCDTKSLSVQACCTVLSCSFWASAGATSIPGGARSTLAAGGAVSDCAGAAGAGAAGAAAAAGSAGFGAAAFTADLQGAESLASLRTRHSNASLPPGWTPEQLAMKSERQAARMASR